ncbi:hypothetical protein IAE37_002624 [Pseudomonas sp. S31]|uniref:hypothetical protein n=1 Tax=Pseudomonas sp. S31 TaxID=1564473 RepID=UPI001F356C8E|nr:hypothetical protein [Pseudomonas sp. S31]MBK5000348.1 hypothetical protein [Pseudomonas sp. S31]
MSFPHVPILSPIYTPELHKDDYIADPRTQHQSFGYVPLMKSRQILLPEGHIYLRAGRQIGRNKGYGVRHIWEQHFHELPSWGYRTVNEVAAYVASVIVHKAAIYCEFHQTKNGYRIAVLRSAKGVVILEPIVDDNSGQAFYSVVTAYRINRRGHGTQVGKVIGNAE